LLLRAIPRLLLHQRREELVHRLLLDGRLPPVPPEPEQPLRGRLAFRGGPGESRTGRVGLARGRPPRPGLLQGAGRLAGRHGQPPERRGRLAGTRPSSTLALSGPMTSAGTLAKKVYPVNCSTSFTVVRNLAQPCPTDSSLGMMTAMTRVSGP